jgi:hypothetical protein
MLRVRLGLLGLLLGLSACTIPNESHCGNHDGDQTCAEGYGDAIYCSTCVADNDGCVAEAPSDVCRFVPQDSDETGSEVMTASATLTGTPMNPSTTASSASASGSTSSDSMTSSPVTASSTSSDPTSETDATTTSEDPTTTTDPTDDDSTTTGESTDPTDVSTTSPTTDPTETTDDPSMTSDPTEDPTENPSTGEDCVPLGLECDEASDCCSNFCVPDVVLGVDVCI